MPQREVERAHSSVKIGSDLVGWAIDFKSELGKDFKGMASHHIFIGCARLGLASILGCSTRMSSLSLSLSLSLDCVFV